jgi:hypothetical protein
MSCWRSHRRRCCRDSRSGLIRVEPILRAAALLTCLIGACMFLVTVGVFGGETQRWATFSFAAAIVATSIAAQVVNVHASEFPAARRQPETKAA